MVVSRVWFNRGCKFLDRLPGGQGADTGERLTLDYLGMAEKFIDLYWWQVRPYQQAMENNYLLWEGGKNTRFQRPHYET